MQYLHTMIVAYDHEVLGYFEPRKSYKHRSLMCTEKYFQVPQACILYLAIYLESNFNITSILFFVMIFLSLICTQFSVYIYIYIYMIFFNSIERASFKCGKFYVHHILHMVHRVAVVC
jgi:hypothetical protein